MAFTIQEEKCVGCGACAWGCLFDVPKLDPDKPVYRIEKDKCVGCGHCENICPNNAIVPLPDHRWLKKVTIDPEKCVGCTVCQHVCPDKAPVGERGKPFEINQEECDQCGMCVARCRHDAIIAEYFDAGHATNCIIRKNRPG